MTFGIVGVVRELFSGGFGGTVAYGTAKIASGLAWSARYCVHCLRLLNHATAGVHCRSLTPLW